MDTNEQLFTRVAKYLEESPDLAIDGAIYKDELVNDLWLEPNGRWTRTVDIYAYPYIETQDQAVLNDYLLKIASAVPTTRTDLFRRSAEGLYVGRTNYFESIGNIVLDASVTIDDLLVPSQAPSTQNWSARRERPLEQMTAVHLFPSAQRAHDAGCGFNVGFIPGHNGDLLKLRNKHTRSMYNFPLG